MLTVRDHLVSDNEFYKRMLRLVPPQLLSADNDDDDDDDDEEEESRMSCDESVEEEGENGGVTVSADKSEGNKSTSSRVTSVNHNDYDDNDDDDLATKLHKKLEALKAVRCKSGSAESLERNRLKRRLSKAKLKQRRRKEKESAKVSGSQAHNNAVKTTAGAGAKSLNNKPIFNKEGKVVFSKFDFSGKSERGVTEKGRKTDVPTGRNYKQLLEKVHKQSAMIADVERVDKVKAGEMKEKILWKKVLSKAEGVKVRDDPDLLKRALKKKEKRSEKRKKDWKKREEQVEKKKKGRQEKRKQNILKRKTAKHEKIKKKSNKKGRLIAGF